VAQASGLLEKACQARRTRRRREHLWLALLLAGLPGAPTPINQARWDIQFRDASQPGVHGLSNQARRQPRGCRLPRRQARGL